jgi:hypothetical protein
VYLILEGFACRYKILPNGKRHIVAYLVPGDSATCMSSSSSGWITALGRYPAAQWQKFPATASSKSQHAPPWPRSVVGDARR